MSARPENVRPFDETRQTLSEFLATDTDGTYYVGHACILVRLAGKKYLIDPVMVRPLLLDSWLYFPSQVMDARILDVDGVFISHFHEDHYDPRLLDQLRPGTPIYVTGARAILEPSLRAAGRTVVALPPLEQVQIAAGVFAYAMPSEYNKIDSSFVLRSDQLCVYQGNDNFLTAATLVRAREVMGAVDHAFVPYAYIWWYPFCLGSIDDATREREGQRLIHKYLDIGLLHTEILGAQVAVPNGGNLVYYDRVDSVVNTAVYSPLDFKAYADRVRPDLTDRVLPMFAGDYLLQIDGKAQPHWTPRDTAQFKLEMAQFLTTQARTLHREVPSRHHITLADGAFLQARLQRPEVTPQDYILVFQRADLLNHALRVDLLTRQVTVGPTIEPTRPWIRFEIEPLAFEMWMGQHESFEVVLETSRFVAYRQPEQHDPKVWEVLRLYF